MAGRAIRSHGRTVRDSCLTASAVTRRHAAEPAGELLSRLRCPRCLSMGREGTLSLIQDSWLRSEECGYAYPIVDGIPTMTLEEGARWQDRSPADLPVPPGNRADQPDVSVIIPAIEEGPNLATLLPALHEVLDELHISSEILIITNRSDPLTVEVAGRFGARVIEQRERGYGGALRTAFGVARGAYLLTMDADLSHRPAFIRDLWACRDEAEVVIASRYVPGGRAQMSRSRYLLSRVLNAFFSRGLSLRVRDMSSGFRLIKATAVTPETLRGLDFNIVQEVLVRAYAEGWRVREVPFDYAPREYGSSHARVVRFGLAYLRTFASLWKLRNSILAADYDDRAYDSPIFLQRYWQRQRYRHVTALTAGQGPALDVGSGSSRIMSALPPGSVAVDVLRRKLRYAKKFGVPLVQASGFRLPFPDGSFPCVLCSQVIEHVPKESALIDELCRVVEPGGRLVLGTPDYASWVWVVLEKLYGVAAPGGYADEHIAHYRHDELIRLLQERGFTPEANRYILRGELILAFRKHGPALDFGSVAGF